MIDLTSIAESKDFPWAIEQIARLSETDLLSLKVLVDQCAQEIRSQVNAAKAAAVDGNYSDPHWFRAAESAARWKGRMSQAIQVEQAKRRASRRVNAEAEKFMFNTAFKAAAKLVLPDEMYQLCIEKAKQLEAQCDAGSTK